MLRGPVKRPRSTVQVEEAVGRRPSPLAAFSARDPTVCLPTHNQPQLEHTGTQLTTISEWESVSSGSSSASLARVEEVPWVPACAGMTPWVWRGNCPNGSRLASSDRATNAHHGARSHPNPAPPPVSSPRRRGPNCPQPQSLDRPHQGARRHPNPGPTHSVIPAKAGIQAASRTSPDSALDSRLRGNDAALNDTSVHVTSSMPPIPYPPFRSTAFDPPRDHPYSPPATANLRRTDEVRAVAMDGPGRRAQGSSPATVERRPPRGWCRHHPSRGAWGAHHDAQPHSNEAARLPRTSHPPDFARRTAVTPSVKPRGAAARPKSTAGAKHTRKSVATETV